MCSLFYFRAATAPVSFFDVFATHATRLHVPIAIARNLPIVADKTWFVDLDGLFRSNDSHAIFESTSRQEEQPCRELQYFWAWKRIHTWQMEGLNSFGFSTAARLIGSQLLLSMQGVLTADAAVKLSVRQLISTGEYKMTDTFEGTYLKSVLDTHWFLLPLTSHSYDASDFNLLQLPSFVSALDTADDYFKIDVRFNFTPKQTCNVAIYQQCKGIYYDDRFSI